MSDEIPMIKSLMIKSLVIKSLVIKKLNAAHNVIQMNERTLYERFNGVQRVMVVQLSQSHSHYDYDLVRLNSLLTTNCCFTCAQHSVVPKQWKLNNNNELNARQFDALEMHRQSIQALASTSEYKLQIECYAIIKLLAEFQHFIVEVKFRN